MRFIKKDPEHVGYFTVNGESVPDFRCPNKKCGIGIDDSMNYCPACGQKLGGCKQNPAVFFAYMLLKEDAELVFGEKEN